MSAFPDPNPVDRPNWDAFRPEPILVGSSGAGAPGFLNAWVNYDTTGVDTPAAFYKDALGIVHLSGWIKNGTINLPAFILPEGFRPWGTDVLPGGRSFPVVGPSSAFAAVIVRDDGRVIPASGLNTAISLHGIHFLAK